MSRNEAWKDYENVLIIEDYFEMLKIEITSRKPNKQDLYNKLEFRRRLKPKLEAGRTLDSIKLKNHNISAVLRDLGSDWIPGYKPQPHYQRSGNFVDEVARQLKANAEWLSILDYREHHFDMARRGEFSVDFAPTKANRPPPTHLDESLRVARKYHVAERDEKNRKLSKAGQEMAFEHERAQLRKIGRYDLAARVKWISRDADHELGYDIRSFGDDASDRLVKVKTTFGWEYTPFVVSGSERAMSKSRGREWCLFRLWDLRYSPKAFEVHFPLEAHASLVEESYLAEIGRG